MTGEGRPSLERAVEGRTGRDPEKSSIRGSSVGAIELVTRLRVIFGFNLRRPLFERADDRPSFGGCRNAGAGVLMLTSREFMSHLGAP